MFDDRGRKCKMQCNKSNYPFARIICLDHITTATTPFQKEVNNEVDEFLLWINNL